MSDSSKKIVIVNGSPKTTAQSVSGFLAAHAQERFAAAGIMAGTVRARASLKDAGRDAAFAAMREADALLLVFPLYIFCMPALLTRFLEDYAAYLTQNGGLTHNQCVYALVNCGFPEPEINNEAIRVAQSFARHIGASFGFGAGIGCGGMIIGAKDAPFMKKAFAAIDEALEKIARQTTQGLSEPGEIMHIAVRFPRRFYYFMGNAGWHGMARKNGLKKKDIYAQPYRSL